MTTAIEVNGAELHYVEQARDCPSCSSTTASAATSSGSSSGTRSVTNTTQSRSAAGARGRTRSSVRTGRSRSTRSSTILLRSSVRSAPAQSISAAIPLPGASAACASRGTTQSCSARFHRQAKYAQVIVGVDPYHAGLDRTTEWARAYHDALHPHSAGDGYINMMMDDEGPDRVRASYRDDFEKLVKGSYDPGNVFHVNQNSDPDASLR